MGRGGDGGMGRGGDGEMNILPAACCLLPAACCLLPEKGRLLGREFRSSCLKNDYSVSRPSEICCKSVLFILRGDLHVQTKAKVFFTTSQA
ncbi:MAG: hypothetical protein F6K58_08195 [Symploca sp. SIO2E9]|nr:hypothetical protein [Symploca sp. SIO2E9]